jgi:hypothetical protein
MNAMFYAGPPITNLGLIFRDRKDRKEDHLPTGYHEVCLPSAGCRLLSDA